MKNRWVQLLITSASSLALILTLAAPAAAVEPAKEKDLIDANKLALMAREAKTPAEHATVAKHYRLRAEAFEAKAQKHEAEAQKLAARPRNPLEVKWPAMARKSWQRESQLAVQARRAAKESYDLADRHIRLAVEAELAE